MYAIKCRCAAGESAAVEIQQLARNHESAFLHDDVGGHRIKIKENQKLLRLAAAAKAALVISSRPINVFLKSCRLFMQAGWRAHHRVALALMSIDKAQSAPAAMPDSLK